MKQVYLDYAATTPTDPEVVKEMLPYFTDIFGNPSSIYAAGQEAKEAVEKARSRVARLIGARDEEIIFTSGGTEADNTALEGIAFANESKGNHIITTAIEHHAVTETCEFLKKRGFKITFLKVDKYGLIDAKTFIKAITDKTILVSIMHANNEIGTIEPIAELAAIARERGIYFHTDAVQTVGHIPLDVKELGVDMLSMSGHKLQGPKGVGALYLRKGVRIVPFLHGGGQENRKRATTENVPGIVGFGYAAELASEQLESEAARLTGLRDRLIGGLQASMDHIQLNGHPAKRLPNNVNVSVEYVEGESMLLNLDLEGISASSGSACTSGSLDPSHVLLACGLPHEQAHGSLRLTLGKWTVEEDIDRVLDVLPGIVAKLRAMSPLLKSHG
ncbi:MAG: cysteine desulfurase NifS [Dehalococcoidales bacterium]